MAVACETPKLVPDYLDTVIVGGGPSSLILSYILHGHVPVYNTTLPHFDQIVHRQLTALPQIQDGIHSSSTLHSLLSIPPSAYSHLSASLRYSSQALPINTLLDTLIRPNADTDPDPVSCVDWIHHADSAVDHIVITDEPLAGGQWASGSTTDQGQENAIDEIGALSYAEQLSLPGYEFADFYRDTHHGDAMDSFERPSKREVADYLARYPYETGISQSILTRTHINNVEMLSTARGPMQSSIHHSGVPDHAEFFVEMTVTGPNGQTQSCSLYCRNLVLASGVFNRSIAPPPLLASLASPWPTSSNGGPDTDAVLIIGSGFSAADAVIATAPDQHIVHLFRWNPEERPSPLKGCHYQAYPEYATVYRRMKMAAINCPSSGRTRMATSPLATRKRERNPFERMRHWDTTYEGLPNAEIVEVIHPAQRGRNTAQSYEAGLCGDDASGNIKIRIRLSSGEILERAISRLHYSVGRRGSLDFLDASLKAKILPPKTYTAQSPGRNQVPSTPAPQSLSNGITKETTGQLITGKTLRPRLVSKADGACNFEVAPNVYAIGSLTGDSLVRHAFGACVWTAGRLIEQTRVGSNDGQGTDAAKVHSNPNGSLGTTIPRRTSGAELTLMLSKSPPQHSDLHIDRREIFANSRPSSKGG